RLIPLLLLQPPEPTRQLRQSRRGPETQDRSKLSTFVIGKLGWTKRPNPRQRQLPSTQLDLRPPARIKYVEAIRAQSRSRCDQKKREPVKAPFFVLGCLGV